jgi:hypothetical protein
MGKEDGDGKCNREGDGRQGKCNRCRQIGKAWVEMAGMGCWRKMRYRRERVRIE